MSTSKIIKYGILALVAIFVLWIGIAAISVSNHEKELKNTFDAEFRNRTAFFDKMWKTFDQKGQIAVKNDSSFQKIVQIQMDGQKDGEQVAWKWVQQSNPAATFTEVSAMYKDLSRAIEAGRGEFFEQEKTLQDVKFQHDNLIGKFPGSVLASMLGRKPLEYKPITSDRTDEVIKTGKDNNVNVF